MNKNLANACLWLSKGAIALLSAVVFSYFLASFLFNDPVSSYSTYGEAFGIQFAFTLVASILCLEKYQIKNSKWVQSIFKLLLIVLLCALGSTAVLLLHILKWGY